MEQGRRLWIAFGLFALMAAILVLTALHALRRTAYIALPETEGPVSISGLEGGLTLVTITPDTVQAAVATLSRPDSYFRAVTVTQYWAGGSGVCTAEVTVYAPWTRVDFLRGDGRIRHTLTDGADTYIWYDGEGAVFHAPAGDVTADDEQYIPTYEDVLRLPPDRITAADYRTYAGLNCIYVETAEDTDAARYWISVDSGLLAAAERLTAGETVYRMEALSMEEWEPVPEVFTLPDGTIVTPVP